MRGRLRLRVLRPVLPGGIILAAGCAVAAPPLCELPPAGGLRVNPEGTIHVTPMLDEAEVGVAGYYAGWIHLSPGVSVPAHTHPGAEEFVYVLCGSAQATIGERMVRSGPESSLRMPPDVEHAVEVGPQGLLGIQIYRPGAPGVRFYRWPGTE